MSIDSLLGSRTIDIQNQPQASTQPQHLIVSIPKSQVVQSKQPYFSRDPNHQLGATAFSEGGTDPKELRAIIGVILNRASERKVPIQNVIQAPNQFQGTQNPQYKLYFNSQKDYPSQQKFNTIQEILKEVKNGTFKDPTGGANFFAKSPQPSPFISNGRTVNKIGNHYFYKGRADYPVK